MAKKKDYNYFDACVRMADYVCQGAEMLLETLRTFDPYTLPKKLAEIHKIEHEADLCKHELMNRLMVEFIAPIEREDIIDLAQETDDVMDAVEDVLMRLYMYNIKAIRAEALSFAEVIVSCCTTLREALRELHNFKKSDVIHKKIVEVNHAEEVGDKLYLDAVHSLYLEENDPIVVMAWTETLDRLEKCCDNCEDVANVIESVIMKNT